VILNHLRALQQSGAGEIEEVILLHGGRTNGLPEDFSEFPELSVQSHALSELEYDSERAGDAEALPQLLESKLQELNGRASETILHAHNHSLGKNIEILNAIRQLAERGWRWLLQIHDFAEDFRPTNYNHLRQNRPDSEELFGRQLYPQAEQIHYAVLNGRDREVLGKVGLKEDCLHLLPNPVFAFDSLPDHKSARSKVNDVLGISSQQRLLVYPVRGIRRKNVGEMLLWSAVGQGELICALTLPPANPLEKKSYDEWKSLAERLQLPCLWEIGTNSELSFVENISAADQIMTTSVAEGFGMVFLEAWLAGRPLCGRDLPEITRDFKQVGLWYPQLAANFLIPTTCLDLEVVRKDFLKLYQETLTEFGLSAPEWSTLEAEFEALIAGDAIDFAILPRDHQMTLIENLTHHSDWVKRIRNLNPHVQSVLKDQLEDQQEIVSTNAETILSEFSLKSTGERLHTIYQSLLNLEPGSISAPASPLAVRDEFLKMSRFQPLRVEP